MTLAQPRFRNIGIVAHVDAGKTTTTEQMLFTSGRLKAAGRVDEGTAHTDWLAVERNRGISVRAAVTRFEWRGCTINLIDTPGHIDFSAEVERSLRVLDGVVLVVSAVDGVQAHTETLWHALQMMNIPSVIYVNKVDRLGVNLADVLQEMQTVLSPEIVPVQTLNAEGPEFCAVKDIFETGNGRMDRTGSGPHLAEHGSVPTPTLDDPGSDDASLSMPLRTADSEDAGYTIPFPMETLLDRCYAVLAENDEQLLESYIDNLALDKSVLAEKLRGQALLGQAYPVLFGASLKGIGVPELLDAVISYLPAPALSSDDELSGVVFKVERHPSHGRTAYVRLFSGKLENRDAVLNQTRDVTEKVTQIRQIDVQSYRDIGVLTAGDVGAVYGLSQAQIGDVLGTKAVRHPQALSVPLLTVQVRPQRDENLVALVAALAELDTEDPALAVQWLQDEREIHIKVMGVIQLEVLEEILLERFGLHVSFSEPSVIYKETPKQKAEGFVAYTMPKPCWAILRFVIEPAPRGSGVSYSAHVRTEDLLQSYQNEVERRVPEALQQGLYGWEVTDVKVTLVEGQHHVWHTHPLDFVVATPMGIMDGLQNAGSQLLEPVLTFRLSVPEEFGGRVLSDLSQMRAQFGNPDVKGGRFTVEGTIPLATSLNYPVQLGILTGGRGVFTTRFLEYRECPPDVHAERTRRGVNPLDTAKYILWVRNALSAQR